MIGEVGGLLIGPQLDKKIKGFVQGVLHPGAGLIDLVDHDDDFVAEGGGAFEDELGLGYRPLLGVDQQEASVGEL